MQLVVMMSGLPPSPMRRYRTVGRDLRYRSAPPSKCSASGRVLLANQVGSTSEVHPGHKRVRTAATHARENNALRRATINVATPRADGTAIAIWPQRIAVSATVADQRDVCLVHSRRFNEIKPGVMSELQARLWW